MAVETDEVKPLVDFVPEGLLVTSFYLNVDAREFPSPKHIEKSLDSLLHTARGQYEEIKPQLSHEASESIAADLNRIESYVRDGFRRDNTNGLGIFACSAQNFWEVMGLPYPVESRVVYKPRPYVTPLAVFFSHTKPTAVLLVDRKRARIITMRGSTVKEWTDLEDRMIHRTDQGGWSQKRYQRHADAWAKHHVDHAANLVLRLEQHYPFDWLILGVEIEVESDVMKDLHPYVKDRLIGTIHVRIDAPVAEVVEKAKALREQVEDHLIDTLMGQIQEQAAAGGRGTVGLSDTLEALNEQRVHILLVQDGYTQPGYECSNCGLLMPEEPGSDPVTCPACDSPINRVGNVVDSGIQRGFELGANVEVSTERDQLQPIAYFGSITYY